MGTFAEGERNKMLDAWGGDATYTANAAVYAQLHTGDPGAAGTSNVAGETTRQVCSFSAASAGAKTTDADIAWTNVSTSETYSHVSFWTASSAGTFLGSDDLPTPQAVTAGNNFTIPAADLDLAIA